MLCAFVYIYILSVCIICMYVIRSISNIEYIINNECHVLRLLSALLFCMYATYVYVFMYMCMRIRGYHRESSSITVHHIFF